jgi:hypothetical protein
MTGYYREGSVMCNVRLLRRKAASEYLSATWGVHRAPSTLAKLAVTGGGPTFRLVGRVPYYSPDDLDEWVLSKLSRPMRSTSDTDPGKDDVIDSNGRSSKAQAVHETGSVA